jgi:hypothetical protein
VGLVLVGYQRLSARLQDGFHMRLLASEWFLCRDCRLCGSMQSSLFHVACLREEWIKYEGLISFPCRV